MSLRVRRAPSALPRLAVPRFALVLAGALATSLFVPGCVGPGISKKLKVVRGDIEKAEKSGAMQCAPRELALAKTHAEFSETELFEGDFARADDHITIAVKNVQSALVNSKDCGPKRVLIKKNRDQDGDGIEDKDDKCPERPEDFDEWQDEDGCPDPDNDNDKVLDPVDLCKNDAEDIDLFEDEDGCPDLDNDKDEVLDTDDKCPNTPGPVENKGCPVNDIDGDGIPDGDDTCPEKPEDFDGDRDEDGCPDVDTDGDGLEDDLDKCPTDPEDKDGFEDEDGCPEVDNDGDGILDASDKCPNIAGPLKSSGCPDKDGDTFPDIEDKCPDEPGVERLDDPTRHGCPLKDTDGDGIYDKDDKCPNEVGIAQPDDPEKHGCPKKYKLIIIKKDKIEIKQQVLFETNKSKIKPASFQLLAEVADAIRNSNLKTVRIEGHTDSVGSASYNLRLSQSRADSVKKRMVDVEGLDADMLVATGFGEENPIASNRTKAGRAQNRRVEFNVDR